jgi:hypothetical protein
LNDFLWQICFEMKAQDTAIARVLSFVSMWWQLKNSKTRMISDTFPNDKEQVARKAQYSGNDL